MYRNMRTVARAVNKIFFAHTSRSPDSAKWQPLKDHLRNVALQCRQKALNCCPGTSDLASAAQLAGLLHDLGKYRPEFQQYLNGLFAKGSPQTYHKQAGAAKAYEWNLHPVAFAIQGHHGGLPDRSELLVGINEGQPVSAAIWSDARNDCPELAEREPFILTLQDKFHAELITRVLFSCLVDADWSDTGDYERRTNGWPAEPRPPELNAAQRLKRVETYIAERAASCPELHIKKIRAEILSACLSAADEPPGLFSLTVPTGGGKTLASLAFALQQAHKHGLRRVIYVAPYMSILEQNIGVFRDALELGNDALDLFEHYSLAEPSGDDNAEETRREAAARRAENWEAPFVVTTNVQFFESLFSNMPGRCRKLHNIARSVVILDECQTVPPGLVAPTCGMLKQLAGELGATVVLCTATQPAFNHAKLHDDERLDAREIIPVTLDLFASLKRVRVNWPNAADAPLDWPEVAARMRAEPSALCVVNTKKAARAIYDELKNTGIEDVFHLSTTMCPQHRREKFTEIKERLDEKRPCYLVSTQLIEAGVDVDFPFLMREMGPLESVIQAAGRCNREGKLKDGGRVVVFRSVLGTMPPDRWYNAGRDALNTIINALGDGPQIDDPAAIQDYFSRLYHAGSLDADGVQLMRQKFQFRQVAGAYRLISDAGQPVVVATWQKYREYIASLLAELAERPRRSIFRKLAPFQVNALPSQLPAALIHEGPAQVLIWDGGYENELGITETMADVFVI